MALDMNLLRADAVVEEMKAGIVRFTTPGRNFSVLTLFLLSACQRVNSNTSAFRMMASARNYPVAGAILRMQIDTAMRVNGLLLMEEPNDGIERLLGGERYDRLVSKTGEKLRDSVLLKALAKKHAWLPKVYERTSGMVHLSGMQIHHVLDHSNAKHGNDDSLSIDLVIGPNAPHIPEALFQELSEAFLHVTMIASMTTTSILESSDKSINPPLHGAETAGER
ncbi:hypothetical protein [Shinella oryzae]|uniref:Uncharacterized protein n=1 Tax=Shinella oryzae TaxID=2871820 RepID=A0ABY9K8I1_9HYPH|nr:hypothetical protein [Shinella oryzae]WLS03107.1 hypothetical protein Q9315_00220 [Shinella oryzae]